MKIKAVAPSIFIISLLPRLIYPVSRPVHWFLRSKAFMQAILNGNLYGTYWSLPQSGDIPATSYSGVTVMWLSGLSLNIFYFIRRKIFHIQAKVPFDLEIFIGILPLAVTIAAVITICFFLLRKLIGTKAASICSLFLALDPYHIANSKVLHLDALVSSFMVLSVISLILYLEKEKMRWLFLSAISAGLAFLTKTPSFCLVVYCLLALSLGAIRHFKRQPLLNVTTHNILYPFAVWFVIAGATFFIFFPAMWIGPISVLKNLAGALPYVLEKAHGMSRFFMGKITKDLGILYYLMTILFKTTVLSLLSFLLACGYTLSGRGNSRERRVIVFLLLYTITVFVSIGIAAKKISRFSLPIFPGIDIIAGLGLVYLWQLIAKTGLLKAKISTFIISAIILGQFFMVISFHPYYGTHYNLLFGGIKTASRVFSLQDQAEGLDKAVRYLNQKENAEDLVIKCTYKNFFRKYFKGKAVNLNNPSGNYVVIDRNRLMRNIHITSEQRQLYKNKKPEKIITFHGVPYVWIYKVTN